MKWILYILIVGVAMIVNQTIFNLWPLSGFVPNLIFLLVLSLVITFHNWDFILIALLGGYWLELILGLPVGSYIIGMLLIGVASTWVLRQWMFRNKDWRHFLGAVIISVIVLQAIAWIYSSFLVFVGWSEVSITAQTFTYTLVPKIVANLLFAYPILLAVEFIASYTQRFSKDKLQI